MAKFGARSESNLITCHPDLRTLFRRVVLHYDCTILCGKRGRVDQEAAFNGTPQRSKVNWPNSKHNVADLRGQAIPTDLDNIESLSRAIDVAPWFLSRPYIRWDDQRSWDHFTGYVEGVAFELGIRVRSGHDWDGDNDFADQRFVDSPHWELVL